MKIAVFGKPGGGKSTLSRQIAAATKLPLHQLDLVQYQRGGTKVPDEEFLRLHAEILAHEQWVVDGFGNPQAFAAMLHAANVLVYVERFSLIHYWWVAKRLLKSPFSKPLGWPEGSPMLSSTISSYRFLRRSPRFWNSALKAKLLALRPGKRVYVSASSPMWERCWQSLARGDRTVRPNRRVNRTAGKRCLPVRFGLRPSPAGYAER